MHARSSETPIASAAVTIQSRLRPGTWSTSSSSPGSLAGSFGAAPGRSNAPMPRPSGPPQWMQRFVSGAKDVRQRSQRTSYTLDVATRGRITPPLSSGS